MAVAGPPPGYVFVTQSLDARLVHRAHAADPTTTLCGKVFPRSVVTDRAGQGQRFCLTCERAT